MRRAALLIVPLAFLAPISAHALGGDAPTSGSTPVTLGTQSWYDLADTCVVAGICISPNMTYPADTLHVGVDAGAEETRTAIALPSFLPSGEVITGGMLKIPLDTSPLDGSVTPELSKVVACPTAEQITANSGGTTLAPVGNCATPAPAVIVGTPATELDIDLKPIANALSEPGTNLILAASDVGIAEDSWDVAFSATTRTGSSVAAPTLTVTYAPGTVSTFGVPTVDQGLGIAGPLAPAPTTARATSAPKSGTTKKATTKPTKAAPGNASGPASPVTAAPVAAAPPAVVAAGPTGVIAELPATGEASPTAGVPVPVIGSASAPAADPTGNPDDAAVTLGGGGGGTTLASASSASSRIYDYPEVFFLPFLLAFGIYALGRQLTRPIPGKESR